jgi:sigma-B regulation protein RsbU (phosphoserine phosphatase)
MKMPQYSSYPTLAVRHSSAARLASDITAKIQTIQDTLPSPDCRAAGIECAGECERSGNLGGDFFDFLLPQTDQVLAAIGNVALVGITGSLVTTGLQVCLRLLGSRGVAPAELSCEINRMLWRISPDHAYATMFCACINPQRQNLAYVNAGHETAFILRSDVRMERLEPNGPVLGFSGPVAYRQRVAPFRPGDTLIAVSDGLSEASEAAAESGLCEEELLHILQKKESVRIQELPARVLDTVSRVASAGTKDKTVIVARYLPSARAAAAVSPAEPWPRRSSGAAA